MFVDFITPTRVISSYKLLNSPVGVITRQKCRKCWGIALKAGGRTVYRQDGKEILSDRSHVVLLPKGARYEWTCTEPGECIVIDFDAPEGSHAIHSAALADDSFFLAAFARLEACINREQPLGHFEAMEQLYGLLAFLTRAESARFSHRDKRHILSPAMAYILENYTDPQITNDLLSQLCGVSTVYFRKTFESVYGTSPIRYLHELRISKAKAILSGDFGSIGQVAESVGYSSVYHFSKMFRIYTGSSPTGYAASIQLQKTDDCNLKSSLL